MIARIAFLAVSFVVSAAVGQVTFNAPESVANGEAIRFNCEGAEAGDIVQWRLLHPRGVGVKEIATRYGVDHIVDPPVGYAGTIEVLCTVVNWQSQKFIQDELIVQVLANDDQNDDGGSDDGNDVDPPDDDDPVAVDVGNDLGVGLPAYTHAPDAETAVKVAKLYRAAGEFLYGRPDGQVKFISAPDHPKRNDPDYNVLVWLSQQIGKVADSEWSAWSDKMAKAFVKSQEFQGYYTRDMWYEAFNEVADALELVK